MTSDDDDDDVIIACATQMMFGCAKIILNRRRILRKRRWWMVSLNKSRERYSGSDLIMDLRREPSGKFENFCRMSSEDFEFLLNRIGPKIIKKDTNMRKAIPIQERLAVTLRFLASGESYHSLSYLFKMSHQVISIIIPEVCAALIDELKKEVKTPKTPKGWHAIAEQFKEKWNFPNCAGALDGKHVVIQAPINSGSQWFNYKNTFSIVLMALVDANYCFLYADVGSQGSVNDAGVFRNTTLYKMIENEELMLPPNQVLPGRERPMPFVFVGDGAFPLGSRIMKPYPNVHSQGSIERIFNYRLSRARRVVENAFGIMSAVFRIFRSPILLSQEKVGVVTMTCVLLHNFLRNSKTSNAIYTPPGMLDTEEFDVFRPGIWRNENDLNSFLPFKKMGRRSTLEAKVIRAEFGEYFMGAGSVKWQNKPC